MTSPDETEAIALTTFRTLCAEKRLLDRPSDLSPGDLPYAINDETTLRRFLRARRLDLSAALTQFLDASQFRTDHQTLSIYDRIRVSDFEAARHVYPHWTGRRTKSGLPICFADIANITKSTTQGWKSTRYLRDAATHSPCTSSEESSGSAASDESHNSLGEVSIRQLAAVMFDNVTRFVLPLCDAVKPVQQQQAVSSTVIIADAATVTIAQGFDLRGFARDVSALLAGCYPEVVERIFVCNCPAYFPLIWKVVKGWVDPHTAEKLVFLTPAETYAALTEVARDEDLPAQVGGSMECRHGMMPDLDAGIRAALVVEEGTEKGMLPGPMKWVEDEKGVKLVAVGSIGGKVRKDVVARLRDAEIAE